MDGYWGTQGNRYVWVPGRWDRPPYQGAYWTHPHYDRYQDGWHMHEGHWDREDHGDHYSDRRNGDNRGDGDRRNGNNQRDGDRRDGNIQRDGDRR